MTEFPILVASRVNQPLNLLIDYARTHECDKEKLLEIVNMQIDVNQHFVGLIEKCHERQREILDEKISYRHLYFQAIRDLKRPKIFKLFDKMFGKI